MAARRALIRESDLRRLARVSRDEGVSIRGKVACDGTIEVVIEPRTARESGNSFDEIMGGAHG